jgi:hypothetical protein
VHFAHSGNVCYFTQDTNNGRGCIFFLPNKGGKTMPEITRFYGIVIKMFFKPKEHEPSHIHAFYGECVGIYDLKTLQMTDGDLPIKARELVEEWLRAYGDELQEMWDSQQIKKLPPL